MDSDTSKIQTRRRPAGVKEPVVKRKVLAGKLGIGRGQKQMDKVSGEEQNREMTQGNKEITRRKMNNDKGVTELELRLRIEEQSGDGRKNVETATGVVATGKEKSRRGSKTGGGDGEMTLQMCKDVKKNKKELFKTGAKTTERGKQGQNEVKNKLTRTASKQSFSIDDYLKLLKLLKINLPNGALNQKVIQRSANPNVILDAQAIIKDLENFQLKFTATPRLGCREVKHALILKKRGNIQELTRIIFFENSKDSEKTLKKNWETNVSNTAHGFRMKDRYITTPISTPTMYATAETRSWKHLEPGEDLARVTDGKKVNVQELEKMEFSNESQFRQAQPSPQRFGIFFRNPNDEMECLKFFHEQKEITAKYEKLSYTKGNKVEFGFLTGNLDFLVEAKHKTLGSAKSKKPSTSHTDKIIIECKGTTGNMVGKLFTKPSNGSCQAQFIETHEYWYQTQAYMYILKRVSPTPAAVQAVMVVRHYHSDSSRSRDFYWNYVKENKQIDKLRIYCQEEVLAQYLAVLSLIYQKEAAVLEKT